MKRGVGSSGKKGGEDNGLNVEGAGDQDRERDGLS